MQGPLRFLPCGDLAGRGGHVTLRGVFQRTDAAVQIADALLGEITPAMANAVCQSGAKRVLIPVNHCDNYIVGVPEQPVSQLVSAAVQKVKSFCDGEGC